MESIEGEISQLKFRVDKSAKTDETAVHLGDFYASNCSHLTQGVF